MIADNFITYRHRYDLLPIELHMARQWRPRCLACRAPIVDGRIVQILPEGLRHQSCVRVLTAER